ncbi:hypothetical protein OHB07_39215 (plasmid) [Streptomyces sp. NBC_00111]|uniref:hypothetical protein n=1 Tax=Streptomyces sp. NBC_00111 TaxID=2975655 RepID=UPI002F916AEF
MSTSTEDWFAIQRVRRRKDLVKRKEALTPMLREGLAWPFPDKVNKLSKDVVSTAVLGKSPNESGARIYVLEFRGPGQYVKLGSVDQNYRRRVLQHRRIARVHQYALVDAWFSPHVPNPTELEGALKKFLRITHTQHDGEYFIGLDFDHAAGVAGHLTGSP